MNFVLLAILGSVACSINGQVAFKAAMNALGPAGQPLLARLRPALAPLLGGCILYAGSMFLWLFALSRVELSFAFPFLSLSYVGIVLSARFRLHEALGASRLVGAGLIIAGVLLVTLSS